MDPNFLLGLSGLGQPRPARLDESAGLVVLDIFAVQGEQGTGFEKAGTLGEFECGNCLYFDASAGACNQADMKKFSKQPRLADGRVSVAEEDCCEYVKRVGKKDNDVSHS
jgi:hypothetical protein